MRHFPFFQPMGGSGSGIPLRPQQRAKIVAWYQHGVRGHGLKQTAEKFGVSHETVRLVVADDVAGGDVMGQRLKTGRPRELTQTDIKKLVKSVECNPYISYDQLAAVVHHRVHASTVFRALKRLDPPIVQVSPVDVLPVELTPQHREKLRDFLKHELKGIAIKKRVYADESFVHGNIAPGKAKGRRGKKLVRPRNRWSKRYTLHVYTRQHEIVHWELSRKSATDAEIRRITIASVIPKLQHGEALIWDRLGRSGRSKNPKAQHYNPEVKEAVEAAGARVVMLPPYGKLLDPVELLFNDLKSHYLQPAFPKSGEDLSFEKIRSLIRKYMKDEAPKKLPGFFRARATGRELDSLSLL
jgi:hypothetical protein